MQTYPSPSRKRNHFPIVFFVHHINTSLTDEVYYITLVPFLIGNGHVRTTHSLVLSHLRAPHIRMRTNIMLTWTRFSHIVYIKCSHANILSVVV
jgi:hypothetical protein